MWVTRRGREEVVSGVQDIAEDVERLMRAQLVLSFLIFIGVVAILTMGES
jgi:predicted PurR-regulated permease PerM